jgi:hypothetical protein
LVIQDIDNVGIHIFQPAERQESLYPIQLKVRSPDLPLIFLVASIEIGQKIIRLLAEPQAVRGPYSLFLDQVCALPPEFVKTFFGQFDVSKTRQVIAKSRMLTFSIRAPNGRETVIGVRHKTNYFVLGWKCPRIPLQLGS